MTTRTTCVYANVFKRGMLVAYVTARDNGDEHENQIWPERSLPESRHAWPARPPHRMRPHDGLLRSNCTASYRRMRCSVALLSCSLPVHGGCTAIAAVLPVVFQATN